MTVFVVDIEEVPTRYTAQWKKWYKEFFERNDIEYNWIGFDTVVKCKKSEFLSFIPSNIYKTRQTHQLAMYLEYNHIKDGDMIFFLDAWHPGIPAVRQMLLSYDKDVKMAGFWHAGSYDPYDMLGQTAQQYFIYFEKALYDCLDYNLFATNFSEILFARQMGFRGINIDMRKSHVAGFIYDVSHLTTDVKEDYIIFPHRLAIEKGESIFDEFEAWCKENKRLEGFQFIKTLEVTNSKDEYHNLLAKSKFAISFSSQETFGISMMESAFSGCVPIVPDSLSYQELYPKDVKFSMMQKSRESIYTDIADIMESINASDPSELLQVIKKGLYKYIDASKLVEFFMATK